MNNELEERNNRVKAVMEAFLKMVAEGKTRGLDPVDEMLLSMNVLGGGLPSLNSDILRILSLQAEEVMKEFEKEEAKASTFDSFLEVLKNILKLVPSIVNL